MAIIDTSGPSRIPAAILGWRRIRVVLIAATALGLLHGIGSVTPTIVWVARDMLVGLCLLVAFGLTERWPVRIPSWLARWVLQIVAIVVIAPLAALLAYWMSQGGRPDFAHDRDLLAGYGELTFSAILFVTGVEAAQHIGSRAHLVFVTAYDQYAVQAFAQGALDYLVKPVDVATGSRGDVAKSAIADLDVADRNLRRPAKCRRRAGDWPHCLEN